MHWDALKWSYESADHANLKAGPQAVLVALAYSMHPSSKACYSGIKRLAALTHQGESTVARNLNELKKAGLIVVHHDKKQHETNTYSLNYQVLPKKDKKSTRPTPPQQDAEDENLSRDSSIYTNTDQPLKMRGSNLSNRETQPLETRDTHLSNRETNINKQNICSNDFLASSSISSPPAVNEGFVTDESCDKESEKDNLSRLTHPDETTKLTLASTRHVANSRDCAGYEAARKVVESTFPNWLSSATDQTERSNAELGIQCLSNALALFPDPTPDDAKALRKLMRSQDDWVALNETTNAVKKQIASKNYIANMRQYFKTAFHVKSDSNIAREAWRNEKMKRELARLSCW